jgi:thiamine-phosphate pyrophosphorylase
MTNHVYRIIDANCNRIGDGLRILEDIARFLLNDSTLSSQLKEMRHQLVRSITELGDGLLSSRDTENDIGPAIEVLTAQTNISAVITANCKRIEEALRSVEELAKLPELSHSLASERFNKARFAVYTIERELQSQIPRLTVVKKIKGIYAIVDTGMPASSNIEATVHSLIKGGAKTIQLRDSLYNKGKRYSLALTIKRICQDNNIPFIVNNDLDIALAVDADGIHIGQNDLPVPIVRKYLPVNKIIGYSTHSVEEALSAKSQRVDYIGVGSIFPTTTKKDIVVIGPNTLRTIREKISIPLVAIGGINSGNITQVISAGADAAAVISAIFICENIEEATRILAERFHEHEKQP